MTKSKDAVESIVHDMRAIHEKPKVTEDYFDFGLALSYLKGGFRVRCANQEPFFRECEYLIVERNLFIVKNEMKPELTRAFVFTHGMVLSNEWYLVE